MIVRTTESTFQNKTFLPNGGNRLSQSWFTRVKVSSIATLFSPSLRTSSVRPRKIWKHKKKNTHCPGFYRGVHCPESVSANVKGCFTNRTNQVVGRIRHRQEGKGRLSSGWLLAQWDWEPYLISWPLAPRLSHLLHAHLLFFFRLGLREMNWTELPDVRLWCQSKPSCRSIFLYHYSDPLACRFIFLLTLLISVSYINAAWDGCAVATVKQERSTDYRCTDESVQWYIKIINNQRMIWLSEWCPINNCNNCNNPNSANEDLTPFDFYLPHINVLLC